MKNIRLVHQDTLSCEAIFRVAPDGHYIIVSQCGGPEEPHIDNRVVIFHSYDKGKTWSKPVSVVPENGKAQYQTEVSIINDEILIFMCEHDGHFCNSRTYVLSSKDNGLTFEEKITIPHFKGFVFIRGMIQVGEEYIFPYQFYKIPRKTNRFLTKNNKKIWEGKLMHVEMGVLKTSDFNKFTKSKKPCYLTMWANGKRRWVWSEPTVVNFESKLVMFLRYDQHGFLYRSESMDNGNSWSEPVPTDIPNPGNKPKIIKWNDNYILLNTPKSETGFSNRTPLEMWMSKDLVNWNQKEVVCDYSGWISYPDGVVHNNELLFAFEYNRKEIYFVSKKLK